MRQLTAGGDATAGGQGLKIELNDQERRVVGRALVERRAALIESTGDRFKLAQRSGQGCLSYQRSHPSYENCDA